MGKMCFAADMEELTMKAIIKAHDYMDVVNDLRRIQETINYGTDKVAGQLDCELRQKYPAIIAMLQFAASLPMQPPQYSIIVSDVSPKKANLWQDYYGILCDAAIKKGIKKDISYCIDHVEDS